MYLENNPIDLYKYGTMILQYYTNTHIHEHVYLLNF